MAKNFIQEGNIIVWSNTSGKEVVSGQPVVVGDMVGVALLDIPSGESAAVQLVGVWELPKVDTLALTQGETVYLNGDGLITTDPTDNVKAGIAFVTATQTDVEVEVLLGR